ncbi:MAG: DUF1385 domain-containing protein [Anaerolinea sp.]|nr:DUF1385 domain-containing protein [Anaerolinea sp.]
MKERLPTYGGQAVIEGVLMRGTRHIAMAMRTPDGSIKLYQEVLGGIYKKSWMKLPFLRGLIGLWDALILGMRFLTISANTQTGEDEKLEGLPLYATLAFSMIIGVGLFFLLPAGAGHLAETILGWNTFWGNMLEGLVRLVLLVGYIWLIGKMPDIKRVFQYHGAEHKTINAFEAGCELTPENVAKHSLQHPRCGTSFLLALVVLSIFLFAMLGPMPAWARFASRIVLLPLLASVAYEYIRFVASHIENRFFRFIIKPNLALQKLTTREPSLDQLEVAIAAFSTMYQKEKQETAPAPSIS